MPHLVTVAVPTVFHKEVASEAIRRGTHVLIEKPIAETETDGQALIDLARQPHDWGGETFSMSVLALHLADYCNAVSELHGRVARKMWHFVFPDRREEDVPIGYITNGIHTANWMARRLHALLDQHLMAALNQLVGRRG